MTLGGLAVEAGVSKSGLFAHFKSKEDLQLSILDEAVRLAGAHVVAPAMNIEPGLADAMADASSTDRGLR